MRRRRFTKRSDVDGVVTVGRYAKAIGIGRTTAYIQARAGEIPARWSGGRYELDRADFERLVKEFRQQNPSAA